MRDRSNNTDSMGIQEYRATAAKKYQSFIQQNKKKFSSLEESKQATEGLNQTQKILIEGAINQILASISQFDPVLTIKYLEIAINIEVPNFTSVNILEQKIWSRVKGIYDILSHPCPQNMNENDYLIDAPSDPNIVSYVNYRGERVCEPKGLLSLTSKNDDTVQPVTREAVVNCVRLLVNRKIEAKHRQTHVIAEKFFQYLNIEDGILNLTDEIGEDDVYYLCLFLDKHPEIKNVAINIGYVSDQSIFSIGQSFKNMPNLDALSIYGKDVNDCMAIGDCMENISSISFSGKIDDKGVLAMLEPITKNTKLTTFVINTECEIYPSNRNDYWRKTPWHVTDKPLLIGDEGAIVISKMISNKPHLTSLSIQGGCIDDRGAIALADAIIANKLNLTLLKIHGDWISNDGAFAIAKVIMNMSNLISVEVYGNYIRNEGAIAIANAVTRNAHCSSFTLYGDYIDDKGAIGIAKELNCHPSLNSLHITGGNIGSAAGLGLKERSSVKALVSNVNIHSLVVCGNYLKDKAKAILAEKDPVKRANYGRDKDVEIPTEVPSLLNISLFAVKQIQANPEAKFKNKEAAQTFTEQIKSLPSELVTALRR